MTEDDRREMVRKRLGVSSLPPQELHSQRVSTASSVTGRYKQQMGTQHRHKTNMGKFFRKGENW